MSIFNQPIWIFDRRTNKTNVLPNGKKFIIIFRYFLCVSFVSLSLLLLFCFYRLFSYFKFECIALSVQHYNDRASVITDHNDEPASSKIISMR